MKLLLDAHALLWWLQDDDQLPAAVADLIDDPAVPTSVSVVTLWELIVKSLRGRLRLPAPPEIVFSDALDDAGFRALAAERRHVLALPELPEIHGDPFDRMLVAQAVVEDMAIVTGDDAIRRYPVRTIW